jgi:hypothetical protein
MPRSARPPYSRTFLTTYGRSLQPEEIRLVQGFRALSSEKQHALLALMSYAVLEKLEARRPKAPTRGAR